MASERPFGVIPFEFRLEFWHRNLRAIVRRCLCDPKFSHFCRSSTCDRQTDGHNDAYRASIASRGKK